MRNLCDNNLYTRGFRDQSLLIHGSDRMDRMDHEIGNMHHWASPSCEGLTS